jgi:tetratricopeptide (TPR) repeat protein
VRVAVLLVLAIAAPAVAKPDRPKPIPQPELAGRPRPRTGARQVIVIAPTTPFRKQRALDDREREQLERRARTETGLDRIAALDALTAALEQLEPPDTELDLLMGEISMLYARVLFEPGLEAYPYADELVLRAAKSVASADEKVAVRALERMLVKFPSSPFLSEAHLTLAGIAESKRDYATAKRHLEAILSNPRGPLASYARLKLGWLFHTAKDYPKAVAQLARVITESNDRLIVEAAADSIIAPYAFAGRAGFAAILFDHVGRGSAAERLRNLAAEYGELGKRAEEAVVLRAAIVREGDLDAICRDRADIVAAMTSAHNSIDAEVAIAELAEAVRFADASCAAAADDAVGTLALEWHRAGLAPAQLMRAWDHAAALATTAERREIAELNRDALAKSQRAAR